MRNEILSKVAFVLPRHQGLDVRSLLQQDLLLLRVLCLSTAGGGGGGEEEEPEGTESAACWRLHVGLLLEILRRMPATADASLAIVKHVVLPCLDTVAALCLDGVDYPDLRKKEEAPPPSDGDEQHHGAAATAATASGASPSVPDVEVATPASDGGRVEDVVLDEVLRASADARTLLSASATTTGGGGFCCRVGWVTPAQAKNARAATAAAAAAESALVGDGGGLRQARFSSFPEHWLLRLITNKQSPVLRAFSGMVLGAMTAFKRPRRSKEVAEVAAHMVGVVGTDGSEAAGLQTLSLLGRLCSGRPTNRETQAYMEQRGLGGFLAAAVLLETRRLQDQSNAAARPPPPFYFGGPADAATAPPEAPRTGELLLRLAEALSAVGAASSSSSAAMVDGDEWKLLMPAEGAPTTAAETGGSASDATASGHAAGDNEGASSSPPAAGEKAAATDGSAAAAAAAAMKGTAERDLDHVLEAMVRARGIAMPHSSKKNVSQAIEILQRLTGISPTAAGSDPQRQSAAAPGPAGSEAAAAAAAAAQLHRRHASVRFCGRRYECSEEILGSHRHLHIPTPLVGVRRRGGVPCRRPRWRTHR
ncbi:unnamed protein product [Ectocarpus sp. 12 AP-2014]